MKTAKRFRPGITMSIIAAVMLAILVSLGTWQMNRSVEKQQLLDNYRQAPTMPELRLSSVGDDWEVFRYRKIQLKGRYNEQFQLLLENQVRAGAPGFMVLTPFHLADVDKVVLVNRGWIAQAGDSRQLPRVEVADGSRSLVGLISHPPEVGLRIGSLDESAPGWPKAVPYVDLDWMGLQLGESVLPWIVLLQKNQEDGYIREWHPSVRMPPEKHQGYAFQWYSLAIALVFLFVVGSMKPEGIGTEKENQGEDPK
jgi:surfeit locus 1 family protein